MYNVDYFIQKFEAIPENKWCVGSLIKAVNGVVANCANYFCGVREGNTGKYVMTDESAALARILRQHYLFNPTYRNILTDFSVIYYINDGISDFYTWNNEGTPKYRILRALKEVKEMNPEPKIKEVETTGEFIPVTFSQIQELQSAN